jgi:predicted enzyme related to lactoylglutathione lyase
MAAGPLGSTGWFWVGVTRVPVSLLMVLVDCRDPRRLAEFWARALAYKVSQRNPDEVRVSDPAGVGGSLCFMRVPEPRGIRNWLDLDVVTLGSVEDEVTRLVEAGAEVVEVLQDPASLDDPDTWTVMRDPEGNEFCVAGASAMTGGD